MNYMPQLDGVRALSILLVFCGHWVPWCWKNHAPFSGLGVEIFFILSGYLITLILFRDENAARPKSVVLKNFFMRRFLRIFPLYYTVLFGFALLGLDAVRETFFWNLFYGMNILTFMRQEIIPYVGHFWTLAMEEQFYLVWPFVILFLPRAYIVRVMIGMIIVAVGCRAYLHMINLSPGTFPLCSLDFLGFGGLLAYYKKFHADLEWPKKYFGPLALFCFIAYWTIWLLDHSGTEHMFTKITFNSLAMVYLGWLVLRAAEGFKGIPGAVLASAPMVYLGKISYGLYIFHNVISIIYDNLGLGNLHLSGEQRLFLYFPLTIIIASLSWFFFEKPILALKKKFA